MWTRAPPFITSDHSVVPSCVALDQEVEGCQEAFSFRLLHNHQPGEQEQQLEYYAVPKRHTLALDYSYSPFSQSTTRHIHHDLLPEAAGAFKRSLPTQGFTSDKSSSKLSHMSTPEITRRVRPQLQLLPEANFSSHKRQLLGCMSATEGRQLDDMQTPIANAKHTLVNASSDQEVPELVVPSTKRRRVVLATVHNEFIKPKDSPHSLDQACEDHSGVTAEQHMADLDYSSKASTPEDIDSQVPASLAPAAAKSDQLAATPQCSSTPRPSTQQVVEQETKQTTTNVESHSQSTQVIFQDPHPSDDDTQSTSQIRTVWVPQSSPHRYPSKTMASHGSDEWLQLSLGSGVQSEETDDQPPAQAPHSPPLTASPPTSSTNPPHGVAIRDFFKFGFETEATHPGNTFTSSPITPRQRQHYSGTPESSHRSAAGGTLSRPLTFLEPRPRSSRESPWVDPNAIVPRGNAEGQFLSPSPVLQQRPPAFSNLATGPFHPARVLQPVRSEQTETTSVHVSPWMGMAIGTGTGIHQQQQQQQQAPHEPSRTPPPSAAEFLSMATPGAFRDWRAGAAGASPGSILSMQPPLAQGVDPEQAWRNLLQRVGSNLGGFGGASAGSSSGRGEAVMLPPGEREEYLDALNRAVERFQGADQGGRDEPPLTELQRLQRNAMFPPGQRPHLGPPFDPGTDISLARYFNTPPGSGSKPRPPAPASSSDRQRRILRPHAPRPGLWFTLQASNSQPEASPLQQIPTAYIRVVDDNMTVAAVRRYLVNKLGLTNEDEVEITCKGQPLQPSIPLSQVRDGIWQSPNTNMPTPSTPQMLSEGKAWKAPDGSITLVGDVVMVLTYGRRPPAPSPPPTST